jgi:hypothetical protein
MQPETLKCEFTIARRPGFQSGRALVADVTQRLGNPGIVDLPCPRLATTWDIGDLDFTDVRRTLVDQLNEVPLTDPRVVDVQHQTEGCRRPPQLRVCLPPWRTAYQDDQQRY